MRFSARAQKFPDRPGARPANSLEVSRTKKHNIFLEKNPVKTGENYSFDRLTGGPLHGSTVDVPPSFAVTSILLRVAGCARKVACLLAHGEWDGASVTDRHKCQSTQYCSNWYDIKNLRLRAAFVDNF
jgi:hypothetical protein